MKQNILNSITLFAAACLLLLACSKPIVPTPGQQGPPDNPGSTETGIVLQLNLPTSLPAVANLTAELLIETSGTQQVLKTSVEVQQQQLKSPLLLLPKGQYSIVQCKISDASGRYVLATPLRQSAKAAGLSRVLPVAASVVKDSSMVTLDAIAVGAIDAPESFGYPVTAFDSPARIPVVIHPMVNIGGYVFDHIDGQLEVTWYDAQQQAHQELLQLKAGLNNIGLPKDATRFHFAYRKWNITDEMELPANAVSPGMTIALGGAVAARKLKEEQTWREAAGQYQPESRKTYTYNASGKLVATHYYQKLPQYVDLQLQQIHEFEYQNGKLTQVRYFNGQHQPYGYLKFTYANNGLVTHMEQKSYDQTTYAAVSYGVSTVGKTVNIDYLFSNGQALEYQFTLQNGNKIQEHGRGSTGAGEGGTFAYDGYINPYRLLGVQDIYLRYMSNNNLMAENKSYGGGFPVFIPGTFQYSYDEKGYPVQLIKQYKNYMSGAVAFHSKTQYSYLD
ncbi:hypothetical protein [Phnomibacter ginsenosidimutans]|uniref:Uncharacterized protein n=1 Tax=Phnomibacter ginsenosidimutans TaxID=2676868 RepID=A0A6I6GQD1_9BACT|nr:hypothetical protein [Phnomibacter ginsenosidimutans]QGW27309.1 hypothetical protein GLV81_03580 [Phnomibacter ginsenosidimutans]